MAPCLLTGSLPSRRNLAHDLESLFAVTIWLASYEHNDELAFREKPLAQKLLSKANPDDLGNQKLIWFSNAKKFKKSIINYMVPIFRKNKRFCALLLALRAVLYPVNLSTDEEILAEMSSSGEEKEHEKEENSKENKR